MELINTDKYYVTNEAMMEELAVCHQRHEDFQRNGIDKHPVTDKMALMFLSIATKLSTSVKLHYKTKEDQEDCIQRAVMDCLKYWLSFLRAPLPVVDDNGHIVLDENGEEVWKPVVFSKDLMIPKMEEHVDENGNKIIGPDKRPKKFPVYNPDGTVKMTKPNPFSYFTELCKNGLAKGWGDLGYTDLPFGKRVYISDSIYSI